MAAWEAEYNFGRPHVALRGKTPAEALQEAAAKKPASVQDVAWLLHLKAILTQHHWEFVFGQVRYIGSEEGDASTVDDVVRLLRKRRAFSREQEVQCLIHPPVTGDQGLALLAERDHNRPGGPEMSLDPADLIEFVLAAPHAPGWYVDVVEEAVARHGFKMPVA